MGKKKKRNLIFFAQNHRFLFFKNTENYTFPQEERNMYHTSKKKVSNPNQIKSDKTRLLLKKTTFKEKLIQQPSYPDRDFHRGGAQATPSPLPISIPYSSL